MYVILLSKTGIVCMIYCCTNIKPFVEKEFKNYFPFMRFMTRNQKQLIVKPALLMQPETKKKKKIAIICQSCTFNCA